MHYRQFDQFRVWMEQIIQKLDSLERTMESWQGQDEHYHKKSLEKRK